MKRLLAKHWVKLSAGLILLLLLILLTLAWRFRIWNWRDYEVYDAMSRECPPVWEDLYWGRIRPGQDLDEVIAATAPAQVERYGEFVQLNYQQGFSFTGVTITAKKGRLASARAWSCTWEHVFFDDLTSPERKAFSEAYESHWAAIRKK